MQRQRNIDADAFPTLIGLWKRKRRAIVVATFVWEPLEIKRRTNVAGISPNEPAIKRLVGALMLEQKDEWAVTRRCMTLEKPHRFRTKVGLNERLVWHESETGPNADTDL